MLSEEEQIERARRVSESYGVPLKKNAQNEAPQVKKLDWSAIALIAGTYSLPFIAAGILFAFYNNFSYSSVGEVQTYSMPFIVFFIGLVALFILFFKITANEIYRRFGASRLMLALTFLLIPIYGALHTLITGQHAQDATEIAIRATLFSIAAYSATVGAVVLFIKIWQKATKRRS